MAKFFQLAPPDLADLGLGTARLESMQALGFSADNSLLLVKISFTDDGEPTLLSKYATFVYDVTDEKYIANLNDVLGPSANVTQIRDAYIVGNRASWEVIANVDILNSNAQVLKSYSSNGAIIHNLITAEATDLAHLTSSSEIEVENFQLTDDGRYLAVQTSSNLLAIDASDDVNQSSDIYLIDRENGSVSRVSFQGGIGKDDAVYLADITVQDSQVKVAFVTDQYFSTKDKNSIDVDLNSSIESRNDLYLATADIGINRRISEFMFELLSVDADGYATGFVDKDEDSLPKITDIGVYFSSDSFSLVSGDNNGSKDVFISTDTSVQRIQLSGIDELISGADFVGASKSGTTIYIKTSSIELFGTPGLDQIVRVSLTDLNYDVVSNNNVQADNIVINGSVSNSGKSLAFTSLSSNLVPIDQTLGVDYDLYVLTDTSIDIHIGETSPNALVLQFVDFNFGRMTATLDNGTLEYSSLGAFSHVSLDSSDYEADIDISDVISSLKHIVGLDPLDGAALQAADVDNDGAVAIADVISQLKHIVGLETITAFDLVDTVGARVTKITEATSNLQLVLNGDVDLSTALNSLFVYDV